jgi:uncharacterized protein (DUF2141 family)
MEMNLSKVALAVGLVAGLVGAVAEAQQGNTINVPISGLRNSNGNVRCGLYNSAATFPKDGQQFQGVVAGITNQQATCVFTNVPPGTYAVAAFHAEQGETAMRTGMFGQPKEGYGFSRNATGTFGPPSFGDAAYNYEGGAVNFPITISYP